MESTAPTSDQAKLWNGTGRAGLGLRRKRCSTHDMPIEALLVDAVSARPHRGFWRRLRKGGTTVAVQSLLGRWLLRRRRHRSR